MDKKSLPLEGKVLSVYEAGEVEKHFVYLYLELFVFYTS